MAILLIPAIACGSGEEEATPTPVPTEAPTPTPVPILPDLTITNVTFDPATGCAGAPVRVTATIQNQGTLSSQACQWSCQLYPGSPASLVQLPSLPPGGTISMHTSITLTSDITGTFNTTATADTLSEVAELNESNNQFVKPLTVTICDFQSSYNSEKSKIEKALNAYMTSHNGSIPFTNTSITMVYPSGTFNIINICALLGAGDLLPAVPTSCIDSSFDNCGAATCNCQQNAHYIWLSYTNTSVISTCIGNNCEIPSYDGYQGIWP